MQCFSRRFDAATLDEVQEKRTCFMRRVRRTKGFHVNAHTIVTSLYAAPPASESHKVGYKTQLNLVILHLVTFGTSSTSVALYMCSTIHPSFAQSFTRAAALRALAAARRDRHAGGGFYCKCVCGTRRAVRIATIHAVWR